MTLEERGWEGIKTVEGQGERYIQRGWDKGEQGHKYEENETTLRQKDEEKSQKGKAAK